MKKVLMVDDDKIMLDNNRMYFEKMGYQVFCAETVAQAEAIISSASLDCVLLDVALPDESGFDFCIRLRENTKLPVVFLSAYSEEHSRIKGLSIGGDDYVCKPYSLQELELRIRARINAGRTMHPQKHLQYGELIISACSQSISYGDLSVDLSTYEFDVLYFLAQNPNEIFTYEQIFNCIWKTPLNKGIKSLQMMIVRIRQKLIEICPHHEYIQTIRRKGYLFVPQVQEYCYNKTEHNDCAADEGEHTK